MSTYLSKLNLAIKFYRGFEELQKNKFINETVNNFPNSFRQYFKKHYHETYKQSGYLWIQFMRETLQVAAAYNTMSLDQVQIAKSNELTEGKYALRILP